jgi:predicted amidohydrolase
MNVAAVQLAVGDDVESNVGTVTGRVREAAAAGADLVVLPEIWNVGYFDFGSYESKAEPLDGPTMSRLRRLADNLSIYLHTGSIVEEDNGGLYNTSGLVAPDGELLDTYRKMHLFGYNSEEAKLLTPGDRIVSIETNFGTVGLTTCYDLRFPALYRALVDRGVELLLVTSAWPDARIEHWQLLNRVRAIESQTFLVAANLTGTNHGVELAGQSLVIDPWGVPIANAGTGERTAQTAIDLDEIPAVRDDFPILGDRRLSTDYSL